METDPAEARVLILSLRNICRKALFRGGPHYEFEDIISDIDSALFLAPEVDPSSARFPSCTRMAYDAPVILTPGIQKIEKPKDYDMRCAICTPAQDLISVNAVIKLRDICRTSVCFAGQIQGKRHSKASSLLRILDKFDVIMLYYSRILKSLSERIDSKCLSLSLSVDTIFGPYPYPPR
jgi:hypothetical protein